MRTLYWLFVALIAIVAAIFAISNRQLVSIGLWPLKNSVDIALYLALLVPLALGFAIGRVTGYVGGSAARRERARLRIRVKELEAEVARLVVPSATATTDLGTVQTRRIA